MVGSAEILRLPHRRDRGDDTARRAVESHWAALDAGRVPYRDDVDPAALGCALDRVLVIERIAPRQARIRLAGQRIAALQGCELRGMPLSCLLAPASRSGLGDGLETLFDTPARLDLTLEWSRRAFRSPLTAGLTLLPLRDRAGQVTRALGFFDLPHRLPAPPLRMAIAATGHRPVEPGFTPRSADGPDFERADRARDVLRRRRSFRLVDAG